MNAKICEIVTARILDSLKAGCAPWKKEWKGGGMPANLITKKPYRGMNVLILRCNNFPSRFYLTFNQAKAKGGRVKAGEKGTPIIFWNFIDKLDDNGKKVGKIPLMRYYTVFNLSQCEGIADPDAKNVPGTFNPIDRADSVVKGMNNPPAIVNGSDAKYSILSDTVTVPKPEMFTKPEHYYNTLFHEIGHSTGHKSRLDRDMGGNFGSEKYSKEELIAEMTASFLSAHCGIDNVTLDNSAAYVENWLKVLSNDPEMVIKAAGAAQKAADYILGNNPATVPAEETETVAAE